MNLHQQGAAGGIERIRGPRNGTRELAPRQVGNTQPRGLAGPHFTGVRLRHIQISAQGSDLRHPEEQGIASVHQGADIHIAQRDDSVEGGLHQPVTLHLIEPGQVSLSGRHAAPLHRKRFLEGSCDGRQRAVLGLIAVVFLP